MSSSWIAGAAAGVALGVELGDETAGPASSGRHDDDGHLAAVDVAVEGCWKRSADRNGHIGIAGNVLSLGVGMPLAPVLVATSAHRRR